MTTDYKLISEIRELEQGWTAKVIVAEKSSPKIGQINAVRYQPMTLMDVEGFTVRASIYEQHIAPLSDTLQLGKTYLISNANVRKAPPKYQRFEGELQWSLSGACNAIEIDEPHYDLIFSTINLVPFDRLSSFKNEGIQITTMGIIIAEKPLRPCPSKTGQQYIIRDFVLIDKNFETINIRMWGSYAENEGEEIANLLANNPVVIAKNVIVNTYDGLALTTTHDSCFYVDIPFEEVLSLQKWVEENKEALDQIKALHPFLTPKKVEADEDTIASPIKDTKDLALKKHCWIKATAKVRRTSSPYWYMACSNCFTAASTTVIGQSYSCRYCTDVNVVAVPRARAEVELSCTKDTIFASMMGRVAEDFFQATATKLMTATRGNPDLDKSICLELTEDYLFYIKAVANRQWSIERGKSILPQYQTAAKRFEIVAFDKYDPDKHKNITVEDIAGQSETETGTPSEPYATIDLAASSPKAKRVLFEKPTPPSAAKKNLLSKMD